jgi:hypothetical protein
MKGVVRYHEGHMKRHSAIFFGLFTLALAGCSSGGSASTTCVQQYWDGTVGVCLPANWEVMSQETLTQRGMPEEVTAAFQSKDEVAGQRPTITITKETLTNEISASDYSTASIRSVGALPNFKQVDRRKFTWNAQNLEIHIFTAQPLPNEPERRFYQLSLTSKNTGYTVTGFTPVSVTSAVENQVLTIVRSITFTDPAATAAKK